MEIIKENKQNIDQILQVLSRGGLVIFPSETTYGAAVDATNQEAVRKLNTYKQRQAGKPYSVIVANMEMAEKYVELNQSAKSIYKNFLPGPVTVISKGKHLVAAGVESESGALGIRIPKYDLLTRLVAKFDRPITATSANSSYKKRPYNVKDILENISDKQKGLIDLIIDAGQLPINEPSTVIDTTLDDAVVLRSGSIKFSKNDQIVSFSPEATQNTGKELWQKYEKYKGQRAIVFALQGEMGTGKTQMTKGMAKAMGIQEEVLSPSFNLHNEYIPNTTNPVLDHIDAWRLTGSDELNGLGWERMIGNKDVVVIEWADRVADKIREFNEEAIVIWVKIEYRKSEKERLISWSTL